MKQQIARFSPHQNGKVFGVLTAVSSLIFIVPMVLVFSFSMPKGAGPSGFMFLLMPFLYLLFGYLSVALGCWIYNHLFKHIGGIEFDTTPSENT
jgi:hypothetical protein